MRTLLLKVLLAGLTLAGGWVQPASAFKPAGTNGVACAVPEGWSAVAARKSRYVIFGEVHGTRESPAFIATTACGLAAKGKRILVAVELNATDDPALQAAWSLPGAQFAPALRAIGWAGRRDGVASQAMFELIVRLHRLKGQGRRIDVVAFSGARDDEQRERFKDLPGQGPHEAAQAENIRRAAEAKRYDHVLVLVGNLHARKQPLTRGEVSFEPMAMRLAPAASVTSLDMAGGAGTMWNCLLKPGVQLQPGQPLPPDAMDCGSHPTRGRSDLHRPPFVGLGALPGSQNDSAYDGFYWLGPVSGSPPAVPGP
ncbi:MAG TPA: hypothetical protein VF574_18190 [Allosphingosinicella sp.]|jgi:hypothetical protein